MGKVLQYPMKNRLSIVVNFILLGIFTLVGSGAFSPAYADEEPSAPENAESLQKELQEIKEVNETLQKRLSDAENEIEKLKQIHQEEDEIHEEDLEAQDEFERSIQISGFMQPMYRSITPRNPDLNISNDTPEYVLGPVHLYIDSYFEKDWRVLLELSFNGSPQNEISVRDNSFLRIDTPGASRKTTNGLTIERAWVSYLFDPLLEIKLGTFIPPHGIYQVDHAAYVVPTVSVPLFATYPHTLTGIQVLGEQDFGNLLVNYSLYTANGPGVELNEEIASRQAVGIERDLDFDKVVGGKLRLSWKTDGFLQKAFIGYNIYNGLRTVKDSTRPNPNEGIQEELFQKRFGHEMSTTWALGAFRLKIQGEVVNVIDTGTQNLTVDGFTIKNRIKWVGYDEYIYLGLRWQKYAVYYQGANLSIPFAGVLGNAKVIFNGFRIHFTPTVVLKVERVIAHAEPKQFEPFGDQVIDQIVLAIGF